jgi:hypothetical protein
MIVIVGWAAINAVILFFFGIYAPREAIKAARGEPSKFDLTEASFATVMVAIMCLCAGTAMLFITLADIPLWLMWVTSALYWVAATYNIVANRDCADAWRDRDTQAQQTESTAAAKS